MRNVSQRNVARRRTQTVLEDTGSFFTGREQLGHRGHDAVGRGHSHHTAGGRRLHQAQPHANREGSRQGSLVRTTVRHTAVLSHHVRARTQAHQHRLRHSEVRADSRSQE